MFQKLDEVEKRYDEITKKISDPEVIAQQSQWQTFMKEHAEIEPVVLKYREYKKAKQAIEDAKEMLKDPEMKELAEIEIEENKENGLMYKKEGKNMAVLAKPINRISVIKRQESQEFVREFNQNKVTNDFLESCKKAGKLFGKRK